MYTGEIVPIQGAITATVQYGEAKKQMSILVVQGDGPNLLGRDWLATFDVSCGDILRLVVPHQLDQILDKHSALFEQLGTLKG